MTTPPPIELIFGTSLVRTATTTTSNMLEKGADVDRAMESGATPLYIACEKGHVDAARLLLEKGAEVDRAMEDGYTPLRIAKLFDHSAVVALLEAHRK